MPDLSRMELEEERALSRARREKRDAAEMEKYLATHVHLHVGDLRRFEMASRGYKRRERDDDYLPPPSLHVEKR